jgi:four helix bundle protein
MSVPANIAEGNGRSTPKDYASFLDRSRGSLFELDTWLFTAAGRGWMPEDQQAAMEDEIEQLSAMILRMATTLRAKDTLPSRAN